MSQPGSNPETQSPVAPAPEESGAPEKNEVRAAGAILLSAETEPTNPPEPTAAESADASPSAEQESSADSVEAPTEPRSEVLAAGVAPSAEPADGDVDRVEPPPASESEAQAEGEPEPAAVEAESAPVEQDGALASEPSPEPEPTVEEDASAAAEPEAAAEEQASAEAEPEPAPAPRKEVQDKPGAPPAPTFPIESPKRAQRAGMMALLKLDRVDDDDTFRLRSEGEIDSLATSIAKQGQLFPVELRLRPPDRFQVVCGFRRVAALRLLKRERVVARVHTDLNDEDALQIALADLLENRAVAREELVELRDRLREQGRLSASVADTLDRAISPPDETLAPEMVEGPDEEVDLDELANDLLGRLAAINQDLALVVEFWNALEPGLRDGLLEQLGYPEQLVGYLRGLR